MKGCHYKVHNYSSVSGEKYGPEFIDSLSLSISLKPFQIPLLMPGYLGTLYLVSNIWWLYGYILLHISNLILLSPSNIHCMISNISFIETYCVAQNIVRLATVLCTFKRTCSLLLYSEVFHKCQLGQAYWQCYSHLL